jgi:hypothetical protein
LVPNGLALVCAQGPFPAPDFWLLDLATKTSRQLSPFNNSAATRSFDVTADGKQIVFGRVRENSDIVVIDLARRTMMGWECTVGLGLSRIETWATGVVAAVGQEHAGHRVSG